jgi:hypothetical protein
MPGTSILYNGSSRNTDEIIDAMETYEVRSLKVVTCGDFENVIIMRPDTRDL